MRPGPSAAGTTMHMEIPREAEGPGREAEDSMRVSGAQDWAKKRRRLLRMLTRTRLDPTDGIRVCGPAEKTP